MHRAGNGGSAGFGDGLPQDLVDLVQVLAEEVVENVDIGGVIFLAVPPEPVAALGDVQEFLDLADLPAVEAAFGGAEGVPGFLEQLPGPLVVVVADPDVEIAVDPGTAFQFRQLAGRAVQGVRKK